MAVTVKIVGTGKTEVAAISDAVEAANRAIAAADRAATSVTSASTSATSAQTSATAAATSASQASATATSLKSDLDEIDEFLAHAVESSATQPTSTKNKIWYKSTGVTETEVPTKTAFEAQKSKVAQL